MKFTMPIPPSVNRIYRRSPFSNSVYKTVEAKKYVRYVRMHLRKYKPTQEPLSARLSFYYINSRRDIDSGLKILLDAMEGCIYSNDSQIKELHVFKLKDTKCPRVEIEITGLTEASPMGPGLSTSVAE